MGFQLDCYCRHIAERTYESIYVRGRISYQDDLVFVVYL